MFWPYENYLMVGKVLGRKRVVASTVEFECFKKKYGVDFVFQLFQDICTSTGHVWTVRLTDASYFPATHIPRKIPYLLSYGLTFYERMGDMVADRSDTAHTRSKRAFRVAVLERLRELPLPAAVCRDSQLDRLVTAMSTLGFPPTWGGFGHFLLTVGRGENVDQDIVLSCQQLLTTNFSRCGRPSLSMQVKSAVRLHLDGSVAMIANAIGSHFSHVMWFLNHTVGPYTAKELTPKKPTWTRFSHRIPKRRRPDPFLHK